MITREVIKTEIDKVQDKYLEILYRIVKAFESSSRLEVIENSTTTDFDKKLWHDFIEETYGCLADDPIERGDQGAFEIRDDFR
jgi:hypothetical protein